MKAGWSNGVEVQGWEHRDTLFSPHVRVQGGKHGAIHGPCLGPLSTALDSRCRWVEQAGCYSACLFPTKLEALGSSGAEQRIPVQLPSENQTLV